MTGTAPIVFGISGWCRLLAHACTAGEHCSCDCHRRGTPRPSTALHAALTRGNGAP